MTQTPVKITHNLNDCVFQENQIHWVSAILADGQDKGCRILVVKTMTSTIQCGQCAKSKYPVVAEGSIELYCHGLYF